MLSIDQNSTIKMSPQLRLIQKEDENVLRFKLMRVASKFNKNKFARLYNFTPGKNSLDNISFRKW